VDRPDKLSHNLEIMKSLIIVIPLLAIGCAVPSDDTASHHRMYEAVADAMCAETREEREAALGLVATEARDHSDEGVEDYVTQMASDVDCRPRLIEG